MKKNNSFAEKCKESSRKFFVKLGNSAVGNGEADNSASAFSHWPQWLYETKMPKRRRK